MSPDDLITGNWREVKLIEHAQLVKDNPRGKWLEILEKRYNGSIFGGLMENRSVFFDERHDKEKYLHIGVDLWAREGTPVRFPHNAVVKYSRPENPLSRGGWGGRLDLYVPEQGVYILGHLDEPIQKAGDTIVGGEIVASLANRIKNGGWWPHLHIQLMPLSYYNTFDPNNIDAYSEFEYDIQNKYLNPFGNDFDDFYAG